MRRIDWNPSVWLAFSPVVVANDAALRVAREREHRGWLGADDLRENAGRFKVRVLSLGAPWRGTGRRQRYLEGFKLPSS